MTDTIVSTEPATGAEVWSGPVGDAAAVLFTAGFTDAMPDSLLRPVASLPLAIFFQLSTPFPAVQARAKQQQLA